MSSITRRRLSGLAFMALFLPALFAAPTSASAKDAATLTAEARLALDDLIKNNANAAAIRKAAIAEVVFPNIVKAGLVIGGAVGEGVLFRNGEAAGFYRSVAASFGLQAGAQSFGYALFFMNEKALSYLNNSDGWELGVGPSIVLVDKGFAAKASSTTLTQDVYAVIFDQHGLMAGLGIEGSKLTRYTPKK